MSPSRHTPRGATLIEAMAALVVFSIGIIGVMQMNLLASQQNNLARSQTTASKIARDVADAFERLPFEHPLLNVTTGIAQGATGYNDMDIADGLVRLTDTAAYLSSERPMLGAADAAFSSEGDTSFYEVAWRAWQIPNPDPTSPRFGMVDQIRILVMVRFPTGGGNKRQVTAWAVKTDSRIVMGDPQSLDPHIPEF